MLSNLVEGHHAKRRVQAACAQALIDACAGLIAARPSHRAAWRVTCGISLPDMFLSELCIYIDEDYFRSNTGVGDAAAIISGRSLADEWGLRLPRGVLEIGRTWQFDDGDGDDDAGDASFAAERWHFGEVGPRD